MTGNRDCGFLFWLFRCGCSCESKLGVSFRHSVTYHKPIYVFVFLFQKDFQMIELIINYIITFPPSVLSCLVALHLHLQQLENFNYHWDLINDVARQQTEFNWICPCMMWDVLVLLLTVFHWAGKKSNAVQSNVKVIIGGRSTAE